MKTVKMKRAEPTKPGGPVTADVHPDEVGNYMRYGWMADKSKIDKPEIGEPPSLAELINGMDSIEDLREFADANKLKLHHNAADVDKAKANLIGQLG